MGTQRIVRHQLLRNLRGEIRRQPPCDVESRQFPSLERGLCGQLVSLPRHVGRSVSDCELTDTYSPADIDIAPATNPATPASSISLRPAFAAATPTMRLAVETKPSLAPRTAAPSQPTRSV